MASKNLPYRIPRHVLDDHAAPTGTSVSFSDVGIGYDFAIDGLPFCSATDAQNPFARRSADVQKARIDPAEEPGEQTFNAWWTKAQASFHGGAGQRYGDPSVTTTNFGHLKFLSSKGVDVWTPGQTKLLATAPRQITATAPIVCTILDGSGNQQILVADGSTLKMYTETLAADGNGVLQPSYSAGTTVNWAGAGTILALCTDGRNYYAANSSGIWKGSADTPGTAGVQAYAITAATSVLLGWVKQRLVAGITNATTSSLYALNANSTGAAALPAATLTHPNRQWIWNSVAEGSAAIYFGGYSGQESAAYSLVLTTAGDFPTLTTGNTAFQLPAGEQLLGLYGYMGQVTAATTSGVRVGQTSGTGDPTINLGPLSVVLKTSGGTTYGGMAGYDHFVYVGYKDTDGTAGLARVDIGSPQTSRSYTYAPEMTFGWSPDLRAEDNTGTATYLAGAVTSVCLLNGRLVFGVAGQGVCVQHPSQLCKTGSLTTSRIRYDTLELKLPRYVRLRTDDSFGQVSVAVGQNTDTPGASVLTLVPQVKQDTGDVGLSLPPVSFLTLTFTLQRDGSRLDEGPTFIGYQVKALPVMKKQRLIQVALNCFNSERSKSGAPLGNTGGVVSRLRALEALEDSGQVINFQTLSVSAAAQWSQLVTIETVQFVQTAGPFMGSTFGGIITLTMRTVE